MKFEKKLSLNKETLRVITEGQSAHVAGGMKATSDPTEYRCTGFCQTTDVTYCNTDYTFKICFN